MEIFALRVPKKYGEVVRSLLYGQNIIDRNFQFNVINDYIEIPLKSELPEGSKQELEQFSVDFIKIEEPKKRSIVSLPFEQIEQKCELPNHLKEYLPRKWELLGDVLILKFPEELQSYKSRLSGIYADVLRAKTVLEEKTGPKGIIRKPEMEIIFGSETETVHIENSIKYKFDAKQLMFSSGNISERLRMAELDCKNEQIVDMFAGIGYFTFPLAVFSKPGKITSIEINPVSFNYLKQNIKLNDVKQIVEPVLGDCRETAPEGIADRVIMGIIKDTSTFLPKAMRILKKKGGIIHYHDTVPNELLPDEQMSKLEIVASEAGFNVELQKFVKIKSFAPGISHIVLDVEVSI